MTSPTTPSPPYYLPLPSDVVLIGSPNDFHVTVDCITLLGRREAEEALTHLILAGQEAGQWVGIKLIDYMYSKMKTYANAVSFLNAGTEGVNILLRGFIWLLDHDLITVDPQLGVAYPTQALINHPGLQVYRVNPAQP